MTGARDESPVREKKPVGLGYRCGHGLAARDPPMRDRQAARRAWGCALVLVLKCPTGYPREGSFPGQPPQRWQERGGCCFGVQLHRHAVSEVSTAGPRTACRDRLIPSRVYTEVGAPGAL